MKTMTALAMVLVLTASLLVGCGCRNNVPATTPTTMPTVSTTAPTTEMTTAPTTQATTEQTTSPTIEDGNGPLPTNATAGADGDTSSATETTAEGRGRRIPESNKK